MRLLGSYLNETGTTDAELQCGFTTACGIPPPQSTYQANSTNLVADTLPILSNNPYWLLQTDIISSTNYLNPDQSGLISCSGVISGNYNNGAYIYSYDNSFDIPIQEDKIITSIKKRILDGSGEPPAPNTLLSNSTVIFEIISPPEESI